MSIQQASLTISTTADENLDLSVKQRNFLNFFGDMNTVVTFTANVTKIKVKKWCCSFDEEIIEPINLNENSNREIKKWFAISQEQIPKGASIVISLVFGERWLVTEHTYSTADKFLEFVDELEIP